VGQGVVKKFNAENRHDARQKRGVHPIQTLVHAGLYPCTGEISQTMAATYNRIKNSAYRQDEALVRALFETAVVAAKCFGHCTFIGNGGKFICRLRAPCYTATRIELDEKASDGLIKQARGHAIFFSCLAVYYPPDIST